MLRIAGQVESVLLPLDLVVRQLGDGGVRQRFGVARDRVLRLRQGGDVRDMISHRLIMLGAFSPLLT